MKVATILPNGMVVCAHDILVIGATPCELRVLFPYEELCIPVAEGLIVAERLFKHVTLSTGRRGMTVTFADVAKHVHFLTDAVRRFYTGARVDGRVEPTVDPALQFQAMVIEVNRVSPLNTLNTIERFVLSGDPQADVKAAYDAFVQTVGATVPPPL